MGGGADTRAGGAGPEDATEGKRRHRAFWFVWWGKGVLARVVAGGWDESGHGEEKTEKRRQFYAKTLRFFNLLTKKNSESRNKKNHRIPD